MDFQSIINELEGLLGAAGAAQVAALLHAVEETLSLTISPISGWFGTIASAIRDIERDMRSGIVDTVTTAVSQVQRAVDAIPEAIGRATSGLLSGVENTLGNMLRTIGDAFSALEQSVVADEQAAVSTIANTVSGLVGAVETAVQGIGDGIERGIMNGVSTVSNVLGAIEKTAEQYYTGVITNVENDLKGISKEIEDSIKFVSNGTQTILKGIGDTIAHAWTTVLTDLDNAKVWAKGEVVMIQEYLRDHLLPEASAFLDKALKELNALTISIFDCTMVELIKGQHTPECIKIPTRDFGWVSIVFDTMVALGSYVGFFVEALNASWSGELALIGQDAMGNSQAGIVDLAASVAAVFRGGMSEGDALEQFRRSGLGEGAYQVYRSVYQQFLAPQEYLTLFFRGLIDHERFISEMGAQGMPVERVEEMIEAGRYYPNVPDLIRMSQRHVFNQDIVQKYQLDGNYPDDFTALAAKAGISEDWAHKHWQAHWVVPGALEAARMFFRGNITEEDYLTLLRLEDYDPYFREAMIKSSHTLLTRVDIRRMYQLGVLNDAEVIQQYIYLGYTQIDAERQLAYTKTLAHKERHVALHEVSRAEIEKAYLRKGVDRSTAQRMLTDIGYDPIATDFILRMADFNEEQRIKREAIATLTNEYKIGYIDRQHLTEQLLLLGLNGEEMVATVATIDADVIPKAKAPTEAQVIAWYKLGIVDDAYTDNALMLEGYNEEVRGYIMLEAQMAVQKAANKTKKNTPPQ